MSLKSTMISLPKLMQHISNPTDNKSHHLPYTSVAAVSKTYFEYMTIYKLYSKTMYDHNFQFLQASNAFTNYPTQKNIQTQKNWLTVTMMKYQEKKPRPCSGKKSMSIEWTVGGAVAAVASWKILTRENLEVESAGIASQY